MVEAGYITQKQADEAAREKLNILPLANKKPVTAPYFHDYVRRLGTELLGMEEKEFEESGLRIYTSLDLKAQKIAEDVVTEQLKDFPEIQTALVAIDPRNGYVKAMVGGRNYGRTNITACSRIRGSRGRLSSRSCI